MLVLLPLAALVLLLLVLMGEDESAETPWRVLAGAALRAAVLWGAYLAASTEILSLFHAISRLWLSAACVLGTAAVLVVGFRRDSLRRGFERVRTLRLPSNTGARALIVGIGVIAGALMVVALASPANNVDSLQYHMARVVHWAQQDSLGHYATGFAPQLYNPPWAETAILQLRVLWGDDRLANFVQWSSMVGCVIGAAALALSLGAGRFGSLVAATFVLSIPMGVLQSTSTQNDYVVALWAISAAFFVLRLRARASRLDLICLALALGLGFLTKATFFVYGPLLLLWYLVLRWRQVGAAKLALEAIAIAGIVLALNLGFLARNLATFGSPYGPLQGRFWLGDALASDRAPDGGAGSALAHLPARYVAKLLKTEAYHLLTPVGVLNAGTLSMLRGLPGIFDQEFAEQWAQSAWNHEDTAGAPIHLVVALLAIGVAVAQPAPAPRTYAAILLGCFLLLVLMIDDTRVYVLRYQLPFFVLAGPVVGLGLTRFERNRAAGLIPWLFLVAALPWVLLNNTRPLIGWKPWPTRVGSVLTADPVEILFAADSRLRQPYVSGTELVRASGCRQVGLRIDSGHLEYLFWWLLQSPQSGIRIESIYYPERLASLADPSFRPCAILCTICGDRRRLHGLPLAANDPELSVFIGPGYVDDPDG